MNHSLKENLITTKDASELSGYTSDYLARLVRSGEIQGKRIGHSWVISSASLETFMTKQKGRKLDRARELASSRVREYNKHNQFVQRTTRALTEKISVPKFRLEEVSLRSHSLALGVALVVVALGAVGANAAALPQVAQRASALATEISSGFVDTFGDVPTRIAVRMEEARIAVRADATRNALASRRAGYVASPVLASIDLETLRTVLVKEYRAPRATSDIAFSSSRADTPILTVTDVYTSAASAYAFFANPSNIGTTLTDAYFAIGTDAYAAVDASFSAYRTLIDASGTPMLAAAATTRDALAHTPRLVAQVNLALGEAVIKATHAAIRTDVIAAHGLAAAAPESARIAVTLMGSTGDTLARAAEQVPARVATAYLNATAVPAVLAPRLAQAVFNAEYAVADRFVSATNAVSGRYLALVEGTGSIAYESSTNARSIVQSASRTIAFAPAALEDVTLGTLGKSAAALDSVTHLSSFAAVLPALSVSEKTALAVYEAIHSAFDSANRTLVAFFTTTPETVLPTGVPKARVIAVATSTRAVPSGTQPVTTLSYPTYTTVVRGVSEDFVNQSLASLRTNVLATVAGMIQPVSSQVVQNITTIQQLNRIDSLHDLVVQNGDFRNSIFDNGIRVNARDGYFDNLTAGTTTLATTTVNGTLTVSSLTLTGSLSSPGSITGSHFVSTSTNATSTFAGSINIDNAGFVYATSTRNVGIGVLSPAALLAVQNSTSTQPIFVASNAAGAEVYRITDAGFVGIGTTSPTYNLAVEGSSTLGNQAIAGYFTATTTTATSTFAGSFTVGTDKLVVNSTTGNIGIGTTSPYQRLSVAGNVIADTFIATSTTATSTFAGGFAVETDGLVYDYSSNNVGIGTAGPANAKLDIRESASGAYGIKLTNRNATRTWGLATDVGAVNDAKFGIFDVTSGGARLTIDINGYVGIGSTSPAQKLVVSGNILTDNANNNLSAYNIINRPTNATYDAANWYQTAGVSKWIAGLLAASSGGTANADDYSIAYYNGSWNNAVTINNSGRVGIGTTSPSGTLAVSGDFFLTGSTTITGADSGIVFTGSGNHDITAAGGTLRIGTNTIIGNIEALNDTVDIGTAVTRFDKIYANEVNASTIVGTLTGGNLSAETFTINSDNATADTENAYLAFERGTITPNATLSWNAAENAKRFELNHPLFIQNASASTTLTTFDLKSVAGQTADILRVASSSSDTLFNVTASGNVSISSTTPWGLLSVNPNGITGPSFVVGSSTATNFIVANGGNVGVGTTNPTSKFEIFGTHGLPATSGTTVTAEAVIGGSTNSVLYMGTAPVSPYGAWLQVSDRSSLGINYPLLLNPNGGNVGIGTTSPAASLDIYKNTTGSLLNLIGSTAQTNMTLWGKGSRNWSLLVDGSTGGAPGNFSLYDNTAAAYRFVIGTGGNVGIGTSTPSSKLNVYAGASGGGANASAPLTVESNTSTFIGLLTPNASASGILFGNVSNNAAGGILYNSEVANGLSFRVNGNSVKMVINASGNVGIGTTTPIAPLSVLSASSADQSLAQSWSYNSGADLYNLKLKQTVTSGVVRWGFDMQNAGTSYSDVLVFDRGNVGIGSTSPMSKLSVVGESRITGVDSTFGDNANARTSLHINANTGALAELAYESAGSLRWKVGKNSTTESGSNVGSDFYFNRRSDTGTDLGTAMLIQRSTGYVGIGTTDPQALLQVNGNIISRANQAGIGNVSQLGFVNGSSNGNVKSGIGAVTDTSLNRQGLYFFTSVDGNAGTEKVRIDSSGNVGIGTTTPTEKLYIGSGDATPVGSATPSAISLGNTYSTTAGSNLKLKVFESGSSRYGLGVSSLSFDIVAAQTGAGVNFYTNAASTPKVTISSGGNLGIGSTTPGSLLSILNSAVTTYATSIISSSVSSLETVNSTNTSGQTSTLRLRASSNGGTVAGIAGISAIQTDWTANSADIAFQTNSLGAIGERMRITAAGNVGIGTTSPTHTLSVVGDAKLGANTNAQHIYLADAHGGSLFAGIGALSDNSSVKSLTFHVVSGTASEAMRIRYDGNLGIGTTSPFSRLSVTGAGTGTGRGFSVANSSNVDNFYVLDNGNVYMKGNVGIGTTSPSMKLHVSGSGTVGSQIESTNNAEAGMYLKDGISGKQWAFYKPSGSNDARFWTTTTGDVMTLQQSTGNIGIGTTSPWGLLSVNPNGVTGPAFVIGSSTATNFIVTNGGSVGIGTASPGTQLDVRNGSGITVQASNARIKMSDTSGSMYLRMDNSNNLQILNSSLNPTVHFSNGGNVGIGTTSPASLLSLAATSATELRLDSANSNSYSLIRLTEGGSLSSGGFVEYTNSNFSTANRRNYLELGSASASGGIIFWAANAEKMRLNSSGNLGIGTSTPGAKLDVYGGTTQGIHVNTTNESPYALLINNNTYGTANSSGFGFYQDNNGTGRIWNNNSSAIAIGTTGNVGIGTTSPSNLLHVQKDQNAATRVQVTNENTGVSSQAGLYVTNSATANYYLTAGLMGTGFTTSGLFEQNKGVIAVGSQIDGLNIFTQKATAPIIFGTGGATAASERMRITETGSVGIGTTTPLDILDIYSAVTNRVFLQASTSSGYAEYGLSADQGRGSRSTLIQYGSAHATLPNALQLLNFNNADLALGTNNTRRVTISGSGLVGIGTTSPNNNLHVYSTTNAGGITIDGTTNPALTLKVNNVAKGFLGVATANDAYITGVVADDIVMRPNAAAGRMVFGSASTLLPILTLSPSGYVGIGTSTPERLLQVHGTNTEVELSSGADEYARLYFKNGDGTGEAGRKWLMGQYGGTAGNPFVFTYAASTGSNWVDALAITNTGYVGIGTTSPNVNLVVAGTGHVYSRVDTTGTAHVAGSYFTTPTTELDFMSFGGYSTSRFGISTVGYNAAYAVTGGLMLGTYGASDVIIGSNNTDRIHILSTGNVGIGTTTPIGTLHVTSAVGSAPSNVMVPQLVLDSTTASAVGVGPSVVFKGNTGNSTAHYNFAAIQGAKDSAVAANYGGYLSFHTQNSSGSTAVTERMRIDSSGNVGIGTSTPVTVLGITKTATHTGIDVNADSGYSPFIQLSQAGSSKFYIQAMNAGYTQYQSDNPHYFSGGNVGIGTTTPSTKLQVAGDMAVNPTTNVYAQLEVSGATDPTKRLALGYNTTGDYGVIQALRNADAFKNLAINPSGGNVGIGTTTPATALQVNTSAQEIQRLVSTNASGGYLSFYGNTSSVSGFLGSEKAVSGGGGSVTDFGIRTTGGMYFHTGGSSTRIAITSDGNVGIGTSSPVFDANASRQFAVSGESISAGAIGEIGIGGNITSTTGFIGNLAFYNAGLATTEKRNAIISASNDGALNSGLLSFYTASAGTNTERMRITSTGNVGIGQTVPQVLLETTVPYAKTDTTLRHAFRITSNEAVASNPLGLYMGLIGGATASTRSAVIGVGDINASNTGNLLLNPYGGKVGIGTTTPLAKLGIGDTDDAFNDISILSSTTGYGSLLFGDGITGSDVYRGYLQYQHATDYMIFGTAATEKMRITSNGNVGIGSTTPVSKLSVAGTGDISAEIQTTSATNAAGIKLTGGTQAWGLYSMGSSGIKSGALGFYDYGSSVYRVVLDNAGNFGIGTTSPWGQLSVNPNGITGPSFVIGSSTATNFIVTNGGNVGIGTASPTEKLKIQGSGTGYVSIGDYDPDPTYGALTLSNTNSSTGYNFVSRATGTDAGTLYINRVSGGDIQFRENGSTAMQMIIKPGGNVGIGTSTPYSKLSVWGANTTAGVNMFELTNSASTTLLSMDNAGNLNVPVATATTTLGGGLNVNSGGLVYDLTTGITSAANLSLGATTFDTDAGVVQWVDMPVTSASAAGTVESYTASLNANPMLTVYGLADGIGGMTNLGVGIGSTSPWATLSVSTVAQQSGLLPLFQVASTTNAGLFTVNGNGNVGIGTTSPNALLTIRSASGSGADIKTDHPGTADYSGVYFQEGGTSKAFIQHFGSTRDTGARANNLEIGTLSTNAIQFRPNDTAAMTIINGGNIGIGTTSPFAKLAIQATAGGSTPLFTIASSTSGAATSTALYVASNGNVGIGTTDPGTRLQIGDATVSTSNAILLGKYQTASEGNFPVIQQKSVLAAGAGNDLALGARSTTGGILFYTGTDGSSPGIPLLGNSSNAIRMVVTVAGNVGIGTTTPNAKLNIVRSVGGAGLRIESPNSSKSWVLQTDVDADNDGKFVFQDTSGGGSLKRMVIDTSGNIGIGTTTPMDKLTVVSGNISLSRTANLLFRSEATAAQSAAIGGSSSNDLVFYTGGSTEAMRILAAGQVGIGTTSPSAKLEVSGATTVSGSVLSIKNTSGSYGWVFANAGNPTTRINLYGLDNTGTLTTHISPLGTTYFNGGNVGIGTTSPATLFEVGGSTANVTFDGYLNCTGFTSNANGLLACTASDERLKQNVVALDGASALAGLNALNPVSFYWNPATERGSAQQYGLIAQQVQTVFPNLVATSSPTALTPDGTLSVNYEGLISPMVMAIQELDARTTFISNAATSTVLTVNAAGNVGIGTTTPNHTLSVAGDIGAIAFVNTSTRNAKTDIDYATASSSEDRLSQLVNLKVATYRYTIEDQNDPLRLGLIAEDTQTIAPEILSADGKGVDIYELATFTLSGVQALAAKVNAQETRMASLEDRINALESGAVSSASGSPITFSTSSLASALEGFGVLIRDGIAQFNTLVFRQLVASRDADGTSSAGSVTIIGGNTIAQVTNSLVQPSTKVFVTFNSSVTGSWWVSDKTNGSFRVVLSESQSVDVSFDYFLVQTEGQIATSTPVTAGSTQPTGTTSGTDTTAPVITLLGDNPLHLSVGGTFVEPGVTVTDNADASVPYITFVNGIEMEASAGSIDTSVQTTYIITYSATDTRGNLATATRSIIIGSATAPSDTGSTPTVSADTTAPVVTLTGEAAMQLTVGDTFTDPGATATDDTDGTITSSIVVSGSVDTATEGLYTLTYTATDAAGNSGSVSRVVTVVVAAAPAPAPAI